MYIFLLIYGSFYKIFFSMGVSNKKNFFEGMKNKRFAENPKQLVSKFMSRSQASNKDLLRNKSYDNSELKSKL